METSGLFYVRLSILGGWQLPVKLVQLVVQQLLVRQAGLVLGDQGRGERTAQGIFHNFIVASR